MERPLRPAQERLLKQEAYDKLCDARDSAKLNGREEEVKELQAVLDLLYQCF